jgi:16S rRNA C967 or C1407 C5-methylase (RsmB/RsmF family)
MLCETCPKRATCTKLCPAAERYVNQDYRGQRESTYPSVNDRANSGQNLPLDNIQLHVSLWTVQDLFSAFNDDEAHFPFLSDLDNKILNLRAHRLSFKQIARVISGHGWGYKESAVKMRNKRAIIKLRYFLSKGGWSISCEKK